MSAVEGTRASRPAMVVIDDDHEVGSAVERDLLRRYSERFRVLKAGSGTEALDLVSRVVVRGDPVALLLADQRMPEMTGVEFLARAMELVPEAKRVLLTAYADTEAAIRAINEIQLDHYLLKPWDPPEERLYPVLDDLLDDWQGSRRVGADNLRIVAHRWSAESHRLRDFLARNQVPNQWIDVEGAEAGSLLAAASLDASRLPIAFCPDGTVLVAPSPLEIAEHIGLKTQADLNFYDLVIVGGGPAGLASAVYGASEGLRTVVVEREAAGGQAGQSSRIENYLGFPSGLSGADLARRATAQAQRLGAEVLAAQEAIALEARSATRTIRMTDGSVSGYAVLLATGVSYRRLEAPGVAELAGKGVFYGSAASEVSGLDGRRAVVAGAANSAGQAAMYLSRFGPVTILCRASRLEKSMSSYLVDQIRATPNIDVRLEAQVAEAHGGDHLEALTIEWAGTREKVEAGGLFVFIGASPHTDWLAGLIARDERGFVLSGAQVLRAPDRTAPLWPLDRDPYLLETNVPGIFVAGDVRDQSVKRVASAVGEGAMAVMLVHQYLHPS